MATDPKDYYGNWDNPVASYYEGVAGYYDDVTEYYPEITRDEVLLVPTEDYHPHNTTPTSQDFLLTLQPGGAIDFNKWEQEFTGEGTQSPIDLEYLGYPNTIEVYAVPQANVPMTQLWLQGIHWEEVINANGYVSQIQPLGVIRWPTTYRIILRYNRVI